MAKKKVDENRTWLNKHIYKKLFLNNIHLISGIIRNIISTLKIIEEANIEENNNLDIVINYLKISIYKNPDLKDSISSLREFIYSKVKRLIFRIVRSKQKEKARGRAKNIDESTIPSQQR